MTDLRNPDASDQPESPAAPEVASGGVATKAPVSSRGIDSPDGGSGVSHPGLRLGALLGALVLLGVWNPWMLVVITAIVAMIALHEFGHYIMAKRAGMKVTEFFLFFGPKVWSIKRGETEYGIKCIPAGAYVKIIGMHNLEEVPETDEGRTYRQKGFLARVGVAVAGSAMHFLLALVMIFVALVAVGQPSGSLDPSVQAADWQIRSITPGSGADVAGLEAGDKVTNIDGVEIETFEDLRDTVGTRADATVPVTYERDGESTTTSITLAPFYSWQVARVVPGTGPAEAGLEPGDQLVSIDGVDTRPLADLTATLDAVEGTTVPVTYERRSSDGEAETLQADVAIESLVLAGGEGYLGVGREGGDDERLNPVEGLVQTPLQFLNITGQSLGALGRFFTPSGISDFAGQLGDANEPNAGVEGPVLPSSNATSATLLEDGVGQIGENRLLSIFGLVRLGAEAGEINPAGLITLFALINIFIGVFNLLPMLPFDGGHVVIAVYEKLQERRLNRRRYFTDVARLLPITYVVVIALGLLFVSTLYLDIANPLSIQ